MTQGKYLMKDGKVIITQGFDYHISEGKGLSRVNDFESLFLDSQKLKLAQEETYGPLLDQGYKFATNAPVRSEYPEVGDADELIEEYERQGLEVEVCSVAFASNGNVLGEDYVAVFTREK